MRPGDGKTQLLRKYGTQIELLLIFSRIPCSEAFLFLFHRQSHIVINAYTGLLCEVEDQREEGGYFFFTFSRPNGTSNDNGNNNVNRGNA